VAFLGIFALAIIFAIPTMLLWNWLLPAIFGIKEIGLLQAAGINLLCGILFKDTTTTAPKITTNLSICFSFFHPTVSTT